MIKVSVIVPVYNTSKFLEKCLNSLINQTLQDIEIICINDGSTDNSLEILEKISKSAPPPETPYYYDYKSRNFLRQKYRDERCTGRIYRIC